MDDPAARYLAYLASFGIAEPGERALEMRELAGGGVRFFALAEEDGLRLKAAVTPGGLVTPGANADDDWHGFLAAIGDAGEAAERIAWLESDESASPDGFPAEPWTAVGASMSREPDGAILFVGVFLPAGIPIPQQWTIEARPDAPAEIEFD
jgi:hypothetical protein